MKANRSAAINLIAQQLYSICPFWASLPYVPDCKKIAHFGQG